MAGGINQKFNLTATIANGASLSAALDLSERTPVALLMPAAWTAASITFQASFDNSTFYNVFTAAGSEYTLTVDVDQYIIIDPVNLAGASYLKVRSGTAAAAQNQGAARSIGLVTREL
jgi:hypothetical protein